MKGGGGAVIYCKEEKCGQSGKARVGGKGRYWGQKDEVMDKGWDRRNIGG